MMDRHEPSLNDLLRSSQRILVLVGAGVSASSGIPTFADLPSIWRGQPYSWLSTRSGFEQEPALTWAFYESMRQTAIQAQPNGAHHALTELARLKPGLLAITQNIDNLSQRAGHHPRQLAPIHGSLFDIICSGAGCQYRAEHHSTEPLLDSPVLPTYNVLDTAIPFPKFTPPRCPRCQLHFLRPGVVWYGELLAPGTLQRIDDWLDTTTWVDLMLVIGTSGKLSSGFIDDARARGATVAHFNIQYPNHLVEPGDWIVPGDVAITLPLIMEETFSPQNG